MSGHPAEIIDLAPSRGWVTTSVLAALWDVHPRTIQRMVANGRLPFPYIQLGRNVTRFPVNQVNRFLAEHGDQPLTEERIEALEAEAARRWPARGQT